MHRGENKRKKKEKRKENSAGKKILWNHSVSKTKITSIKLLFWWDDFKKYICYVESEKRK